LLATQAGFPSIADELTRAYAEQTDQIILARGSEEAATQQYLSAMYGVEAANGRIVSVYNLVEEAALGDGRAMGYLVSELMGLGMTQEEAANAAQYLASHTGHLADVWNSSSAAGSSLASETALLSQTMESGAGSVAGMSKVVADFTGEFSSAAGQIHRAAASISGPRISYSIEHHAQGGVVGGLLTGGSGVRDDLYLGRVNGRVQLAKGGEFIVRPEATKKHLEELEAINADTYSGGGAVNGSGGTPLAEQIRLLRAEISAANFAIAKNTQDTVKLLRKMDAIGLGVRSN
jgi:hypothetical protein